MPLAIYLITFMIAFARRLRVSPRIMTAVVFFFSSRRRHTRSTRDWSSDVCSSDLALRDGGNPPAAEGDIAPGRHALGRVDEGSPADQEVPAWGHRRLAASGRRRGRARDRPLERVRGAGVVRPPALPELGDHAPPRLDGPILTRLELHAAPEHLEPERGEPGEVARVERVADGERPETALLLVFGQEAELLGGDRLRILADRAQTLEDRGPVVRCRRTRIFRVHPVGWDHGEHLVDLEDAARPRPEVGGLLVLPHDVELDEVSAHDERVEADVGRAVLADRHQTPQLLRADKAVDLIGGDVGVVAVKAHACSSGAGQGAASPRAV